MQTVINSITRFIKIACVVMLAGTLFACAAKDEITASASVNAATHLNPDVNQRWSPVMLTFYSLTSPSAFNSASFDDLANNAAKILGPNLIDQYQFEIQPGETKKITLKVPTNTTAIGIVAAYRNIDIVKWRQVVKVPGNAQNPSMIRKYLPHSRSMTIKIRLESQGLYIS